MHTTKLNKYKKIKTQTNTICNLNIGGGRVPVRGKPLQKGKEEKKRKKEKKKEENQPPRIHYLWASLIIH